MLPKIWTGDPDRVSEGEQDRSGLEILATPQRNKRVFEVIVDSQADPAHDRDRHHDRGGDHES